jgi:hypothetical protein
LRVTQLENVFCVFGAVTADPAGRVGFRSLAGRRSELLTSALPAPEGSGLADFTLARPRRKAGVVDVALSHVRIARVQEGIRLTDFTLDRPGRKGGVFS